MDWHRLVEIHQQQAGTNQCKNEPTHKSNPAPTHSPTITTPRTHPLGRVALVQGKVEVQRHLQDRHLLVELHVDHVRLRAVRLPVRLGVVVADLLHAW